MFESLWIDRDGANATLDEMARHPETEVLAKHLRHYEKFGYCIIPKAVPLDLIDSYLEEMKRDVADGKLLASLGREHFNAKEANLREPLTKVLDSHVFSPTACRIAFAPPIRMFLDALFDEPALAFQTLYFEVGSTQAIHNDTAYVVVDDTPKSLCAAWIALEDIAPGSGELTYYPGSHRFGDFLYGINRDRKYWDAGEDGPGIHNHHLFWIHDEAKRQGIQAQSFAPQKGDMLFWHSDLCHGGGKITDPTRTRRSLVVHYCPVSCTPHYFALKSEPTKVKKRVAGGYISSMFYPLTSETDRVGAGESVQPPGVSGDRGVTRVVG